MASAAMQAENPPVTLRGFRGVRQAQDEWCWAAAAASIYDYFAAQAMPPRPPRAQCRFIAEQFPGIDGCLQGGRPDACLTEKCFNPAANRPSHLNTPLRRHGLLRAQINCDGTEQRGEDGLLHDGGFDALEVRRSIDEGCPVAIRVLLRVQNGNPISHFLIIVGYEPETLERFVLWDPNVGTRYLTFDEVQLLYGPLEQKYLTRQQPSTTRVYARS